MTSGTIRKKILEQVVREACGDHLNISTLPSGYLQDIHSTDDANYIILDFPNIYGSSKKVISEIKSVHPHAALIGIHFYLNKKLIEPLMKAGLDAYLLYNPTKTEFKNAMKTIEDGQKYLPLELM